MPGTEKSPECRCVRKSIGILPDGKVTACFWELEEGGKLTDNKFLLGDIREEGMGVMVALWISTGFAATTEFCIVRFSRDLGGSADGGTFAENAGHVLGVMAGAAAYALTGELMATVVVAFVA